MGWEVTAGLAGVMAAYRQVDGLKSTADCLHDWAQRP